MKNFVRYCISAAGVLLAFTTFAQRTPETKVELSPSSDVMVWKTVIEPSKGREAGLALHRHNYARLLIPLTTGTFVVKDTAGKLTKYELEVGKPVALPADSPDNYHTDENFGNKPIEVMVVQFNQTEPVAFDKLTEADLKSAILNKPKS